MECSSRCLQRLFLLVAGNVLDKRIDRAVEDERIVGLPEILFYGYVVTIGGVLLFALALSLVALVLIAPAWLSDRWRSPANNKNDS